MTEKFRCEECRRNFRDKKGFDMHNSAKHSSNIKKEKTANINVKKIRNWGIFVLVILIIGLGMFKLIQNSTPEGEDFSMAVPVLTDVRHIPVGSEPAVAYNSNPPTSGQHYGAPARPGFREIQIEDGHLIHSLEHGLVLIAYHPRIGVEAEKLREVVNAFTLIVQREKNDKDIALASWGRLDTFNLEDDTIDSEDLQRINDFVQRYSNKGPERIPAGQHGGI